MTMFARASKALFFAALFGIGTMGLAGCDEGRFEDAGEEVDEAGEEMQDQMEDAGDEVN